MNGEERREKILQTLQTNAQPISGFALAKKFAVSRQVIVQDVALLRAKDVDIYSTNRGYVLRTRKINARIFKVRHTDEEVEKELNLIVDMGGRIKDVFVYHRVYGVIRTEMNIRSRLDVSNYISALQAGCSGFLKNVTSGYHYHTVEAEDEETLDLIQNKLDECGFLAKLQEYEPVDFSSPQQQE